MTREIEKRDKMILRRALWLLVLLLFVQARGFGQSREIYDKLKNKSTTELLRMGQSYAEMTNRPDSALVCFTIVTNRYKESMSDDELREVSIAYIGRWYVYFFSYFDYAKAFESLSKSREIGFRIGRDKARILLNFGCMYQTMAEQNRNKDLNRKAYNYYHEAFGEGIAERDTASTLMAFSNLVYVAFSLDSLKSIEGDYLRFAKMQGDDRIAYNQLLYKGLKLYTEGQYAEALKSFAAQHTIVDGQKGYERYVYLTMLNEARSLMALKQSGEAIAMMKQLEHMATAYDMKDAKLEVYATLADYLQQTGSEQESLRYRDHYFQLKDTLMNYQQVASMSQLHFLNEIQQLDEQLQEMNRQSRVQGIAMLIVIAVAVALACFFFVIYKKNKLLRKKNEALYQRSLEQMEQPIATLQPQKKYQSSTLGDEEKTAIMQRVIDVMEHSDEIYSADFNIERLAQLVDSKSRLVSQVINELYNDNFNSLLNKYRVREACRRLSDYDQYGRFTLDAISKSVGFRSRNTFSLSFRRFTGLTPSEYQRIAREKGES